MCIRDSGIIALRGRLMQDLPRGSMMAVSASAESIAKILPATLQLASNNAPALCVVSGPDADVVQFQKQLEAENIVCRHLHTSHAFHSAMTVSYTHLDVYKRQPHCCASRLDAATAVSNSRLWWSHESAAHLVQTMEPNAQRDLAAILRCHEYGRGYRSRRRLHWQSPNPSSAKHLASAHLLRLVFDRFVEMCLVG